MYLVQCVFEKIVHVLLFLRFGVIYSPFKWKSSHWITLVHRPPTSFSHTCSSWRWTHAMAGVILLVISGGCNCPSITSHLSEWGNSTSTLHFTQCCFCSPILAMDSASGGATMPQQCLGVGGATDRFSFCNMWHITPVFFPYITVPVLRSCHVYDNFLHSALFLASISCWLGDFLD